MVALVVAMTAFSGYSAETRGNRFEDAKRKYLKSEKVNQLILVQYTGGSNAEVKLLVKYRKGSTLFWKETLACNGYVGKNGIDKTREGDMRTPTGDWGILSAFGIKNDPGTKLPYRHLTDDVYCCGDKVAYNRMISINEVPHKCTGEHMVKYAPAYNYGFFLDYNKECEFGKGSAIFFHCCGSSKSTAGCISVDEPNMVKILQSISINARIIVGR